MGVFQKQKEKIFCIGFNKTGTTTLLHTLKELGYKMGNQARGELLFFDWYNRNFNPIVKYCKTADAFQDIPFSLVHPLSRSSFRRGTALMPMRITR